MERFQALSRFEEYICDSEPIHNSPPPLCKLQEVRPTALVGVPRVWEKFKEKMEAQLNETKGIKEVIISKARVRERAWLGD